MLASESAALKASGVLPKDVGLLAVHRVGLEFTISALGFRIYLNGVEAARVPRWTSGYIDVHVAREAAATLRPGRNVIAIHCRQNNGGQYIDASLIEYVEAKK